MLPAIAVFAKAPLPGRVKTRLAAAVGETEAARLYEQMVSTLLQRLTAAAGALGCDIALHTDISTDAWSAFPVSRAVQCEGDLGARMWRALSRGLEEGRPRMMIVGGDVPTVPVSFLQLILNAEEDVVLGPSEDGGYYAISCRRVHAEMFTGVDWSTARACRQTEEACRRAGLSVARGPMWFDIDEASDLARI
ncbi:MAG: TIGR04282 family arsenosugar biosynthesis glycosyltransferase [Acidobacteria bacterium]|nr:TIGR04282 family arsenosugar biosynthesis glycosyltransferase [Acidobacteriota bacterium]